MRTNLLGIVALLDACVLYPAFLRDFLLRLADAELYAPRWSADIQAEWMRNLLEDRPDLTLAQLTRTRTTMEAAFPQAAVTGYEPLIANIILPDADDRHVVAAAIHSQARVIVTNNLTHFPAASLAPFGIQPLHPDVFTAALYREMPQEVIAIIRSHRTQLTRPPKTAAEYIDKLRQNRLMRTADFILRHEGEI